MLSVENFFTRKSYVDHSITIMLDNTDVASICSGLT
uniref:Uncharacterized protein n=1 Tax=Arundo donax TaxID=35708 RepID=A0A0A8ZGF3_ARUDO